MSSWFLYLQYFLLTCTKMNKIFNVIKEIVIGLFTYCVFIIWCLSFLFRPDEKTNNNNFIGNSTDSNPFRGNDY